MINLLVGFGAFVFGSILYLLSKIKEYKLMAEANTNPSVVYSLKNFLNKEWINILQLYIGGAALVVFLPMLIGGATVDIKTSSGSVLSTFALKAVLIPMYFILGYSGNSAVFNVFGKYKKTLLDPIGGNDSNDKP